MTAAVLADLRKPEPGQDSITLDLVTLTPLYTGGIGQWGDQIHPSGLLGSIRFFSCLVARTLGDTDFEEAVWGNASGDNHHAKGVGLRWDTTGLSLDKKLPPRVDFQREDDSKRKRSWFYNQAYRGTLKFTLTRREISDKHWNLLLLALRIQIGHATFGAKDQFGLGVMTTASLPPVKPLNEQRNYPFKSGSYLYGCCFWQLVLRKAPGHRDDDLNMHKSLRLGLAVRIALRHALRTSPDAPAAERELWKNIRHRMMGSLNEAGSAINVSAAYSTGDDDQTAMIRVVVQLRESDANRRLEILKRLKAALSQLPLEGWQLQDLSQEFGGDCGGLRHPAKWLNKLAGINA